MIVFIFGLMALLIASIWKEDKRKMLLAIASLIQAFMVFGIVTIILYHADEGIINETILSSTEKELNIVQMDTGDYYVDAGDNYVFVTRYENGNIGKLVLNKLEVEFKQSNDVKLVRRDWIAMRTKNKQNNNKPYWSDVANKYKYILYSDLN